MDIKFLLTQSVVDVEVIDRTDMSSSYIHSSFVKAQPASTVHQCINILPLTEHHHSFPFLDFDPKMLT